MVAPSFNGTQVFVGPCKFRNEAVGTGEYELMREYADAMGRFDERLYYFFAKGGFSDGMRQLEEQQPDRVRLIRLEDMYEKQ